jgi:hypothetical protein
MSSKIELPACECGSTDVSIGYESPQGYWVECGDCGYQTDKSHLRELVIAWWDKRAAPAVERQPDAIIEGCMTPVGITHAIYASTVSLKDKEQVRLYRAPPELAELQATIAQQAAEIERLKGGQGEPVAYMRNEVTPDNLVKCTFTCPGAFGVYRHPAPVSVVLPLKWSEVCDPNEDCRYTHVSAETPFGVYSIEWKAHKQFDDRTLFLDGEHLSSGHDLEQAKAKAYEHHSARVMACLAGGKELNP